MLFRIQEVDNMHTEINHQKQAIVIMHVYEKSLSFQ